MTKKRFMVWIIADGGGQLTTMTLEAERVERYGGSEEDPGVGILQFFNGESLVAEVDDFNGWCEEGSHRKTDRG